MYEVPIKWVFKGDRYKGAAYMRRGAALMDMLERFMSFRDLLQGVLRRWVTPDVLIECDKRFGLRTVTIMVAPVSVAAERPEEDVGIPLLVAVSDSTGIHLYHTARMEEKFRDEGPLYGYYERIPDGYVVGRTYISYWRTRSFTNSQTGVQARPVDASLRDGMEYSITRIGYSDGYGVFYNYSISDGLSYTLDACGCKWCRPVLFPWSGRSVVRAFVTRYGGEDGDDAPAGYLPTDALRLSEIALGAYDGQDAGLGKGLTLRRGRSLYTFDETGPVVPLPERNGARRFVVPRWGGEAFRASATDPTLFLLYIFRGVNDVRLVRFPASLLAGHVPEWLSGCLYAGSPANGHYFQPLGVWAAEDEATGELVVHAALHFAGVDDDFQHDGERRRWGMCVCRIVVPATEATWVEQSVEESRILSGTNVEITATAERFLPLLDMLCRENKGRFYFGGGVSYDPNFWVDHPPYILTALVETQDGWERRPVNYTVGDVTYADPGHAAYNVANTEMDIDWDRALRVGLYLFARLYIEDCKALFQEGETAYSWTRHFGGVAVGPDGMTPREMEWPDVIDEDKRTRPDVTYAGNGLFCCVCERMGERVVGVYVGRPFDGDGRDAGWIEAPLVTAEWASVDGNRVVYARPLLATEDRIVVLAVVREMDEEGAVHFRAAVGDGMPGTESTLLRFLGEIPLENEEEGMSWDLCVLDQAHEYARLAVAYRTPPVADMACSYNKSDTPYLLRLSTV